MTTGSGPDPELLGLVEDYFSKTFTPDVVAEVERSGLPPRLWAETEELGLPLIGVDESLGGAGGSLLDLVAVAEGAGRHATPLPLVETALAAWLLASAGVVVATGPLAVVPDTSGLWLAGNRLTGCARHVPWARSAGRVVAALGDQVVSIDPTRLDITPGTDLAGMPRDTVTANNIDVDVHRSDVDADALLLRGALLRSAQIAGAINAALELTNRYVRQRVQFGKPIGAFQAVQAHVVELAEVSALTDLCVQRAAIAAIRGRASLEIVATKSVANRNAGLATRAAHQAHGAIGMTQEYSLQLITRRLHTWRGDFGDETTLNLRLGAAVPHTGCIAAAVTSVGSTTGV
ncbi:acyl-CoA/acyl-ACP dehydrogenase [Mycobacterium sp. CVI_P3]|uniref:Acyl-CoA/acyl-ACP dehydrogenase n=1 Tax=Mycobacterium pinniadriaticum TaxID=2994102 RepID=A0ABT3SKR6_9MYCO|nr:acyl-CoA dehydrogenase family protein [Mycobacterium pinniadriaticum]MCX2933687.1 acyl-CoA/acyl-ACP dehydrogenase [Mycobacterium pinniadriaticum]MCX2940109.1 acyl-CoA/acyl-ACP dehydrogenase [Mycobacterium pinniadriaticum]